MNDEAMSEDELEQIITMLTEAGLVEQKTLEDGRIQLSLTERGRELGAVLPDQDEPAPGAAEPEA